MFRQLVEIWRLNLGRNRTDDNKGYSGYSMKELNFWIKKFGKWIGPEMERPVTQWFNKEGDMISAWKPLGRLPNWSRQSNNDANKHSKKVNRYLAYQEQRILKSVDTKKYNKAAILWMIILKNSFSYQLCLFNKVMPEWHYLLSRIEAKTLLTKIVNKCRCMDLELKLRRFYILKADGKRWRPIGAPDYPSRVISRSLNDLIYVLWEDKFSHSQHGFRRNRGAATAIFNIVNKLKRSPEIVYEFDLKSFFNTVRPMWVYRSLLTRSPLLAELVYKIIMKINYKLPNDRRTEVKIEMSNRYIWLILLQPMWLLILIYLFSVFGIGIWMVGIMSILELGFHLKEHPDRELQLSRTRWMNSRSEKGLGKYNIIKPERELRTKTIGIDREGNAIIHKEPMLVSTKEGMVEMDVPYITREGLPQGLSISPVLATLAMEIFRNIEEIIMYADDGLYIGNSWSKFHKWRQDMSMIGAEIAENKSGVVSERFKFLGCDIDLKKEEIQYDNKVISWWDPELMKKLKKVYSEEPYGKKPKGWTWKMKPSSITSENYRDMIDLWEFPIWDWICIWYQSVVWGLPYKGYRMFQDNKVIDILSASSIAMNEMVKSKAELNLVAIQPLRPIFKGKLSNFCMNKSCYYEEIYENSLRNYIRKQLPEWKNVMENYWDH